MIKVLCITPRSFLQLLTTNIGQRRFFFGYNLWFYAGVKTERASRATLGRSKLFKFLDLLREKGDFLFTLGFAPDLTVDIIRDYKQSSVYSSDSIKTLSEEYTLFCFGYDFLPKCFASESEEETLSRRQIQTLFYHWNRSDIQERLKIAFWGWLWEIGNFF